MWKIVRISGRILSMPQRWLGIIICKPELLQFQSLRQVLKWLQSRRACRAIGTIFWPSFLCHPLLEVPRWRQRQRKRLLKSFFWSCFEIHRSYSASFNLPNIGEFFWNWILKDCLENRCLEFTPSRKREIWQFQVVVVQRRQRNEQKAFCTCQVVIWLILVAFMTF